MKRIDMPLSMSVIVIVTIIDDFLIFSRGGLRFFHRRVRSGRRKILIFLIRGKSFIFKA